MLAAAFCAEASAIGLPDQVFESYKSIAEEIIGEALGEAQRARLRSLLDLVTVWWRTDRRWLNLHLEPIFEVSAFFLDEDVWKVLPSTALLDLMKGDVDREKASFPRIYGSPKRIDAGLVEEALKDLYSSQEATIRARWADSLQTLETALSHRLAVLSFEEGDLLEILQLNVQKARKRADVDDERQRQMQVGQLEAAERILRLAEASIEARRGWRPHREPLLPQESLRPSFRWVQMGGLVQLFLPLVPWRRGWLNREARSAARRLKSRCQAGESCPA